MSAFHDLLIAYLAWQLSRYEQRRVWLFCAFMALFMGVVDSAIFIRAWLAE